MLTHLTSLHIMTYRCTVQAGWICFQLYFDLLWNHANDGTDNLSRSRPLQTLAPDRAVVLQNCKAQGMMGNAWELLHQIVDGCRTCLDNMTLYSFHFWLLSYFSLSFKLSEQALIRLFLTLPYNQKCWHTYMLHLLYSSHVPMVFFFMFPSNPNLATQLQIQKNSYSVLHNFDIHSINTEYALYCFNSPKNIRKWM